MKQIIKKINFCRVCKKNNFTRVFSFGPSPLANAFLTKDRSEEEELFFPLDVYFCNNCSFLTLGHVVDPRVLFGNYVYMSSTSKVFVNHFKDFVDYVYTKFFLNPKSFVIDIGSNDGILLKPFKAKSAKVLGIEPAKHIAEVAVKEGIPTIPEYFNVKLAQKIVRNQGKADIITATNVFAHIDNLDEVVEGLKKLLNKDGIFIMEAPYLVDFLEKKYFDLVYHEHLSYWSVLPLIKLFKRFSMEVFDVKKVSAHGGSIRVFVKKKEGYYRIEDSVKRFLELEKEKKLGDIKTYLKFQSEIEKNRILLLDLIYDLKKKKKKIAAYGAPAKGNTLLNYFGIGKESLDFIVDDNPFKVGLFTPGKHIPVVATEELYIKKPDYLLILAWNFADSIMKMHEKFRIEGGKFIVPVPTPKIYD